MSLVYFKQVSLRYTEHPLLDEVSFRIENKDRVAIIGRNGVGKSTLLKMIEGTVTPDSGSIERNTTRIARMSQSIPADLSGTVADYVALQMVSTQENGWEHRHHVERVLSQLQLEPSQHLTDLSGGQLRRCLLAAVLVVEPDVLLLDEPTNHLDLLSIQWLEGFLAKTNLTFVLISHDRLFLQKLCNKILEVDRGRIISWDGNYDGFLRHRDQQLAAEVKEQANFDKRLAQEEVWIRQGIKARRTRNEGRVRALQKMRAEISARRQQQGNLQLKQQQVSLSGQQVFVVDGLSYRFQDEDIIKDFSCVIQRQHKIGIIGPNGCGKSTLIRCLLGELESTSGVVRRGTGLRVAYFDQHRDQLDYDATVMDEVGGGRTSIEINGKSKHVISYLQDFLFTPQQARSKVNSLSGGECNRLLLAKLFSQAVNVLVLDEPTNDLDIESLELLEEYLLNFQGTVLIISHDRSLLNNVVTSTLVFQGGGKIQEYVGGYDDYLRQNKLMIDARTAASQRSTSPEGGVGTAKLKHEERRELKKLPDKIERLEKKIASLHQVVSEPDYYKGDPQAIADKQLELEQLEAALVALYCRWEALLDRDH